jgi:hypothetical protein
MSTRRSAATAGSADHVGCFQSQVVGIGPQIGFIFPVGDLQGYLNIKGYKEFDAQNRPDGWNAWGSFSSTCPSGNSSASTRVVAPSHSLGTTFKRLTSITVWLVRACCTTCKATPEIREPLPSS